MKRLVRVRSVIPLMGFIVRLEFSDGTVRDVDLEITIWNQLGRKLTPAR
jgi:hypothetical protein